MHDWMHALATLVLELLLVACLLRLGCRLMRPGSYRGVFLAMSAALLGMTVGLAAVVIALLALDSG